MICRQPFLAVLLMASAACASSLKVGYDYDRGIILPRITPMTGYRMNRKRLAIGVPTTQPWICAFEPPSGGNYSRKAIGGSMTRSRISM